MACSIRDSSQHKAIRVEYIGKPDSVDIACECGATTRIGVWYQKAPISWDCYNWSKLIIAANAIIEANGGVFTDG